MLQHFWILLTLFCLNTLALLHLYVCMYLFLCELKYVRLLILISVSFSFLPPLFFLQQLKIVDDLKRALAESSGVCLWLRARLLSQFTPSFIALIYFHSFHLHDFDADLNDAATEEIEFLGSKCRQLEQEKVSVLTYSACFQKCMFIVCIVWMLNSYLFLFSSPSSPSRSLRFLAFNHWQCPPSPP
jgi:hypothetical protein